MTAIKATCHTDGCPVVRGFTFAMDPPEAKRLQRKVLAVAGWLVLGDSQTHCPECAWAMRTSLSRLNSEQKRAVQSALSDALHWSRVEVAGV